jgi:hypothetical protein
VSRVRLPAALALGVALVTAAACTSTVSGTPTAVGFAPGQMPAPGELLSDIVSAANAAQAVHIKGTISDGNESIRLDVQLNADGTGKGTVAENDVTIPLIASNAGNFVQFTADVESVEALSPTSAKNALNKWVPSDSPLLARSRIDQTFSNLQFHTLVPGIFSGLAGEHLQPIGHDDVNGIPVHTYRFSEGTLLISDAPPHYLIRVVGSSSTDSGQVDFTDWDKPTPIAPPPTDQIYKGN